jgi:hypothetical protein
MRALLLSILIAQAASAAPITRPNQLKYNANTPGSVERPIAEVLGETASVKNYGAKCDGSTDDRAAFQAAINQTPNGGTLYVPNVPTGSACLVCSGLPLLITKGITIRGPGGNPGPGSQNGQIMACTGLSTLTDIFLVQPASGTMSVRFYDLSITGQSGTPGRSAIRFDGTNGEINNVIIDSIFTTQFGGGFAISGVGSGLGSGTPAIASISRSYFLGGGLTCTLCGDLIIFRENTFNGPGYAVDAQGFTAGSATMSFYNNYILSDRGMHFGGGGTTVTQVEFTGNEFQPNNTFIGSNGAFVDIDGTAGGRVVDTIFARNNVLMGGFAFHGIRLNYADRTQIYGNVFHRGTGASKDVLITANATNTIIGSNDWALGGPMTAMVGDSGVNTNFFGTFPGFGGMVSPNNKPVIGAIDDIATARTLVLTQTDGSTSYNGYHGNAALNGANGFTYLYDGTVSNNVGLASGSAPSGAPIAVASVRNLYFNPVAFASLPVAPANFTTIGCTDCTIANPCAGGGTGAIAKRLNGIWVCN